MGIYTSTSNKTLWAKLDVADVYQISLNKKHNQENRSNFIDRLY